MTAGLPAVDVPRFADARPAGVVEHRAEAAKEEGTMWVHRAAVSEAVLGVTHAGGAAPCA